MELSNCFNLFSLSRLVENWSTVFIDLLAQASWGEETSQEQAKQQMVKWIYGQHHHREANQDWLCDKHRLHSCGSQMVSMLVFLTFMHANGLFPFVNRLQIFSWKNVPPISALKWMLPNSLNFRCIFSHGKPRVMTEHFFTSIQRTLIPLARWHSNRDNSKRTVCFTLTRLSFRIQKAIRN